MSSSATYAVLVHGWGGSPKTWEPVRWPESWKVLAYTLPGHAERAQEGPWTIPSAAEDLAAYIRENVPTGARTLLIAHSMGGQLSMLVNADHPELIDGEVVIDPAYNGDDSPADVERMRRTLDAFRADPHGAMNEFIQGAFSKYLPDESRRAIMDDADRTNGTALADYFSSEYLEEGSFGLRGHTPEVAKRRTRPVLGFYTSQSRGDYERACDPEGLDVEISLWASDHGHFMHMEDPGRFSDETVRWAVEHGLADTSGDGGEAASVRSQPLATAGV
ncbi:hypothetical protein CS006_00760 [Bifidobacterium primatium]|uniref:AB hydrolase-1 domain-containing protein n=1 Tax=Bifidobacterium primatium TaxID=2045438 RepID=A0A2M9HAB7_9BIFI|nr:alpha/beta hydrolase [Bifidobacterium primatium]PJM73752.1 hypothetical protein CS006_00760 [Bifidobacterium primatium]